MIKLTFQHNLTAILDSMMAIDGAQGAAIVDARTGTCLAERQSPTHAAVGQAATMSAGTLRTMAKLGRMMTETGNLEDIVSTFSGHQHIARPLQGDFLEGLFLFLVLERHLNSDVLAMARYQLMHLVFGLSLIAYDSRAVNDINPQNLPLDGPFAELTEIHAYSADSVTAIQ